MKLLTLFDAVQHFSLFFILAVASQSEQELFNDFNQEAENESHERRQLLGFLMDCLHVARREKKNPKKQGNLFGLLSFAY